MLTYLFWSPTKNINFFGCSCLIDIKSVSCISYDFIVKRVMASDKHILPLLVVVTYKHSLLLYCPCLFIPPLHQRGVYCFTSVRPSVHLKIFFVAFFSATIDGRNLIFGHKLHIGMPYCGPVRFLLPVCRHSWFLYTLNIHAGVS